MASRSTHFEADPFCCTVCLHESDVWPSDACELRPCGHHFHLSCIQQWTDRESTCPNCKSAVTSIVKGSRSKRRRSEVAVAQRKQSVACEDDDEELARELAEEEEEEDGDDASDAGYERDGFVVGDNDVEFYESAEEADAAPLPPRRARAANPAPAPARGGRLRRHARATPDPDSQTSVDEPRRPAEEDDEDEDEAPRLEPPGDGAPPLEDVEDSPPLCDDVSDDDARPPPKRVALRESPPWLPRRTYGTPAPLITQSSARSSSCSGHITSPESDDGDARPVRGGGPASLFDRFRYVEASE